MGRDIDRVMVAVNQPDFETRKHPETSVTVTVPAEPVVTHMPEIHLAYCCELCCLGPFTASLATNTGADCGESSLFVFALMLAFLDGLHEFVELPKLLICCTRQRHALRVTTSSMGDMPLILSILPLSSFSPRQVSPSSCWAYICHSVKNPIC